MGERTQRRRTKANPLSSTQRQALALFAASRNEIDGWIWGGLPHGIRRATGKALRKMGLVECRFPPLGACTTNRVRWRLTATGRAALANAPTCEAVDAS